MKHEKFKMTPLERAWILYDVGNSAFVLMIATLVPIFFNALAEAGGLSPVNYLAYWGLCKLGGHGDHGSAGADFGHAGRYQRL